MKNFHIPVSRVSLAALVATLILCQTGCTVNTVQHSPGLHRPPACVRTWNNNGFYRGSTVVGPGWSHPPRRTVVVNTNTRNVNTSRNVNVNVNRNTSNRNNSNWNNSNRNNSRNTSNSGSWSRNTNSRNRTSVSTR